MEGVQRGRVERDTRGRATVPVTSLEGVMGVLLYGIVCYLCCFKSARRVLMWEEEDVSLDP